MSIKPNFDVPIATISPKALLIIILSPACHQTNFVTVVDKANPISYLILICTPRPN